PRLKRDTGEFRLGNGRMPDAFFAGERKAAGQIFLAAKTYVRLRLTRRKASQPWRDHWSADRITLPRFLWSRRAWLFCWCLWTQARHIHSVSPNRFFSGAFSFTRLPPSSLDCNSATRLRRSYLTARKR